ncbi:hypothetical protein RMCBS344292_01539 [Rhizopus microsporus]|nr:hypothetical protein RMCBS344292_01539 [Rhizopus microsporus]
MSHQFLNGESASIVASEAFSEQIYTYRSIKTSDNETIWKNKPKLSIYRQNELIIDSSLHTSALVSSHTLISTIPQLYQLAQANASTVIHVSAENTHASFADFSNVMAVRQSGLTLLSSSTVQEAYDLAIIAHVVAIKTHSPVLHFFDSKRIASEHATVQVVAPSIISELINSQDIEAYQQYQPQSQPATAYLQYKQKQAETPVDIYAAVQEAMVHFAALTGRHYSPFEYSGHPDADRVVVAMGAGATVIEKTIDALRVQDKDAKIGVLKVRLYRPWSDKSLFSYLPASVKRLAVLEPCQDVASSWSPLFLDVVAAYQTAENNQVDIVSGQYGVRDPDFSPAHVQAVFQALASNIERKFVVASLPAVTGFLHVVPEETEQFVVVGQEDAALQYAQRAVSSGKYAQVYTVDGVSHVRVSSIPGPFLPSLISQAKAAIILEGASTVSVPSALHAIAPSGVVAVAGDLKHLSDAAKYAISTSKVKVVSFQGDFSNLSTTLSGAKLVAVPEDWSQLSVGVTPSTAEAPVAVGAPSLETPYVKMLDQVFQNRLDIANAVHSASVWSPDAQHPESAAPEFGYDADGYETGLAAWQPEFWKSLGVKDVGAEDDEPKLTDDQMKINSNYLRGTIAQDLLDESTGAISEINGKLLKFHGSYGQDDRDVREERKKMGLEKAFSFMIRVRMPGGVSTPAQWLVMDDLADKYANGAIKLTTRQAFQLHGILKRNLRSTIRGINHALLSTLAACGDVNRNIMISPVTEIPEVHEQVQAFGQELMEHLAPKTTAYHEIWLADEQVAGNAVQDFEPIYGPTYLPRKFKIVIAVPPNNDVDIYAHDLGYIAIVDDNKKVIGYNVTIGGGMGMTHGNKKTYPRPATLVGYIPAELAVKCGEAVMTTQRDYGDRTNRKHARFKYTIDTYGIDFIKNEIETRMGVKFQDPAPFEFKDNADRYGWTKGVGDKWHFCMFIENGKVKDWPDFQPKSGLRELAQWHKGEFRLTPNQHLIIANVPEADLEKTKALLAKYKMDNLSFTGLRKNAMACVALPTCGLAMAESERYLPTLVGHLEKAIEAAGLRDDAITIRMTGCPNGCARPYLGEIAFVGKAPNTYNVYLGGGHKGERLNKLYKESLREEEILKEINPIIKRYATERLPDEPFGDFVIRAGYVKKTITGTDFHEL